MKKITCSLIILILCIITLCFFMSGKQAVKKSKLLLTGLVIYAKGGKLCIMDLASRKIKKLYENKGFISGVSKLDSNWVLFGIGTFVKDTIVKFNIKTGETIRLRGGSSPLYMQSYNRVLFYDMGGLCSANINNIHKTKFIVKCPTQFNQIVPISDNEVVFRSGDKKESILLYNVKTNKKKLLPIMHCAFPSVWRDKTKQLICFDREKREEFLTNLDGKLVEKLPLGHKRPVIYIQDKDILLMMVEDFYIGVHGFGPVFNMWMYDFATRKSELLSKYNGFRSGNGIYLPGS